MENKTPGDKVIYALVGIIYIEAGGILTEKTKDSARYNNRFSGLNL